MNPIIPYINGFQNQDGTWRVNPVTKLFWIFPVRLRWLEIHHGFIGLFLMAVGIYLSLLSVLGAILFVIGLYLLIDDTFQHFSQVEKYDPLYHSPVHRFIYDTLKLYDNPVYRALNKFADWLFGSKVRIVIALVVVGLIWYWS